MVLVDITSSSNFDSQLKEKPFTVVHFWAEWCTPCNDIDKFLAQLEAQLKNDSLQILRVEAENLSDITEKYGVEAVPAFLFFHNDKLSAKIEGANPPLVAKQIQSLLSATNKQSSSTPIHTSHAVDLNALTNRSKIMLFMKGSPSAPKCGFSRQIVTLLQEQNIEFDHFDILTNNEVREGLKKLSNWPTYPQLYSNGQLVGGLDVVKELILDGSLHEELGTTPSVPLEERLTKLVNQAPVMLFMKGSPDVPKCGFSRQMVELLKGQNVNFEHFDILTNNDVREGLKKLSNWPTYPQLYSKGQLVGGLDVVKELIESGEFEESLQ